MKKYKTIVADPPWEYKEGFPTQSRTPGKWEGEVKTKPLPYPSMTLSEIKDLPISKISDKDCRLFLWVTNRYLPYVFDIINTWGFEYKQTIIWHKSDGNMGGSVAPNSAEFLIVAIKGTPQRVSKLKTAVWKFPQSKKHSKKPEEFQTMIEKISPEPRIELFARRKREGWDVWGNEVVSDVVL